MVRMPGAREILSAARTIAEQHKTDVIITLEQASNRACIKAGNKRFEAPQRG